MIFKGKVIVEGEMVEHVKLKHGCGSLQKIPSLSILFLAGIIIPSGVWIFSRTEVVENCFYFKVAVGFCGV